MSITTKSYLKAAERYRAFLDEGLRADEAMQRTGLGYESGKVHAYLEAKIDGRRARRPKAIDWRG